MSEIKILYGDVVEQLRTMPDCSVQCCVTSPPYFGLRKYIDDDAPEKVHEIGMEETPELFVAKIVEVFREVRRVLRDDGTPFLNFGDSYASSVNGTKHDDLEPTKEGDDRRFRNKPFSTISSNLLYPLQRSIKGSPLIIGDARTIRITSKCGDIPAPDDGFPYLKFINLLGIERVSIKQRDNNFHQVIHTLTNPRYAWVGVPVFSMVVNLSDIEIILDSGYDVNIIISDLNPNGEAVFRIDRVAGAGSGKDGDRTLTVKEPTKPISKTIGNIQPIGDALSFDAGLKRFPDIYLIDEAIPFRDAFNPVPGNLCNFIVTKATIEEINFTLGDTGCNLGIDIITHFFTIDNNGCLVPYSYLLLQAQRYYNSHKAKQELGIPEMVKRAMMEDGWYCRSTIIWSKPNPMPESVTDRCTKSHEYIFLLTKNAKYFYDADAVREAHKEPERGVGQLENPSPKTLQYDSSESLASYSMKWGKREYNPAGRNRRTVWEIATQPTPDAHFATFPEALVEPCIKAGTSERGCCAKCGKPWERVVAYDEPAKPSLSGKEQTEQNLKSGRFLSQRSTLPIGAAGNARAQHTTGWQPACTCNADTVPCVVLDPFGGSGTTAKVARDLKRDCILIELNPAYVKIMRKKLRLNEQLAV